MRLKLIVPGIVSVPRFVIFACLINLIFAADVFPETSFYEGKTVRIVVGTRPGGTADMRVRAVTKLLSKYIPGNPQIVLEYMPGGGGRKAGNYIYNSARPDGLTIGSLGSTFVSLQILGASGVQYDIDKMLFLGSGNSKVTYVFLTRVQAGLDTLEKLVHAKGVRIGAQGIGHAIYMMGRMFAWLLKLQDPKFVIGYSGPELDRAVITGEVDARVNIVDTVLDRSPEWIADKLVDFHVVYEIPPGNRVDHPAFNGLPNLQSYAKTDMSKKLLLLASSFRRVGSPFVLMPGVPQERIEILRSAFRQVFMDPELGKIWKTFTGAPATPILAEEQEAAIKNIPRDAETIDMFNRLAGPKPLPVN
jgi:tripartite-type tricarboxylate transporter receptor subunit TctC